VKKVQLKKGIYWRTVVGYEFAQYQVLYPVPTGITQRR
jgi:hypothetical protein